MSGCSLKAMLEIVTLFPLTVNYLQSDICRNRMLYTVSFNRSYSIITIQAPSCFRTKVVQQTNQVSVNNCRKKSI